MRKTILTILGVIFFLQFASAELYITEVMHSPDISDPDGEWVEIYNSGSQVNLSNYTLDGNDFSDITIQPNEYIVIARELLDGDDEDLESFESVWGNNNGIWDEPFNASDGSFSLSAQDTIVLTNGEYTEEVTYNGTLGLNGNSMQRLSLTEWVDSQATPGTGNFTTVSPSQVEINLKVSNSEPKINGITWTTDDSLEQGTQIMPNVELPKSVTLTLDYEDLDNDVEQILLEVNNQTYNFTDGNLTFEMQYYDLAQNYNVNITICDNFYCNSNTTSFEYLGIISTTLNTSSLNFDLRATQEQETTLEVINSGNVVVDIELGGTDLVSNDYNISIENMLVYNTQWLPINTNPLLDLDLMPNTNQDLLLKLAIPSGTLPGDYSGVITVTSMEG
ncbi:hypothetical protein CL616_01560 [archaeon]|nr:hypothetical protein [archaeon]